MIDKMPMGAVMNKGLTIKTGQTHVPRYMSQLLDKIVDGSIDPSFVITHTIPIDEAPQGYRMFREKQDGCIKVILKPQEV
jgi:threonine dehydrogenase-like Zn-dependent dehydrogenase